MATATLLPMARAVFTYPNGGPLVGGFVNTFVPGGSTPKLTWQDAAETIPNANPIVLDAVGSCLLYGSGSYNLVVTDALGNQVPAYSGLTQDFLSVLAANVQTLGFVSTFNSIAALRANAAGQPPVIFVQNYYVVGTLGGGAFWKNTTDTTSLDNGGTIIVDGAGNRWYREGASKSVGIEDFGAKCDGVTVDTNAWQQAINAIQGTLGKLTIPGLVTVVDAQLTITAPITIEGVGSGAGPGLLTTAGASVILCKNTFTTGDVFNATTYYQCRFLNFQIAGALGLTFLNPSPRTTGAAIRISGLNPGNSTNLRSIIQNVAFSGFYECVHCTLCADQIIENNYFQAWKNAAYAEDEGGVSVESAGGQFINNKLFGDPTAATTQAVGISVQNGYTDIIGNSILGSQYGIRSQVQGGVPSATHIISRNSIEEQTVKSIEYSFVANTIISILIQGNEFSQITNVSAFQSHVSFVDPGSAFDGNVSVSGNTVNSFITNAAAIMFNIQAGFNVTVNNNVINNNSAVGLGSVFATGGHLGGVIAVLDNLVNGVTLGNIYNLAAVTKVRDTLNSLTFATLGTWGNGSEVYVTDGGCTTGTNAILAAGGSGCTAFRARGNWYSGQYGVTG